MGVLDPSYLTEIVSMHTRHSECSDQGLFFTKEVVPLAVWDDPVRFVELHIYSCLKLAKNHCKWAHLNQDPAHAAKSL